MFLYDRIYIFGCVGMWLLCICLPTLVSGGTRVQCLRPEPIPNGSYRLKRGGMLMRTKCSSGYTLQGSNFIDCVHGKWYGEKPVCTKKGCLFKPNNPVNGQIRFDHDMKATLFCSDNYNLAGNRFSYCNGTHWDRDIGNCRERKNAVEHECDFETEDTCGWVYEQTDNHEWKRVMAANTFGSFRTGPRHDHTTMAANGGHYMLMESLSRVVADVSLISPIYERSLSLKTACCFEFFYFMYGSGVGDLYVIVRPMSVSLDEVVSNKELYVKFKKSGNQNNLWNEANFTIPEMEDDFQIVFVATGGKNHLSDIAIDDVKLMIGSDCRKIFNNELDDTDQSNELEDGVTEEILFDTQSCVSRCLESSVAGFVRRNGEFYGLCNCHAECEDTDSCCPDYRSVCLKEIYAESSTFEWEATTDDLSVNSVVLKNTTKLPTTTPTIPTIPTIPTTKTTTKKITPTTTTKSTTTTTTTTTTTKKSTTEKTTAKPTTQKTTAKPTTQKTSSTTTTTTTTTTKKPTTRQTITTSRTKTTPKTTATTTTKHPTTKPTASTTNTTIPIIAMKINTTTTTTVKPTLKQTTVSTSKKPITQTTLVSTTKISTTPLLTSRATTTSAPTVRNFKRTTKPTAKTTTKKPTTKTWLVEHNVNTASNYHPNFAKIMKYILLCTLAFITVGTLYYRYRAHVISWCNARRNSDSNCGSGDVESSSIIAQFSQKSTKTCEVGGGSAAGGDCKTTLKSKINKRKTKQSCHSGDMSSLLWEDEGVESDDEDHDGGIALQRKRSTEL